jgi:hypothetical protein
MARLREVSINITATAVVILERKLPAPLAPKTEASGEPPEAPNTPARPAPLPACSRTTSIMPIQTKTWAAKIMFMSTLSSQTYEKEAILITQNPQKNKYF